MMAVPSSAVDFDADLPPPNPSYVRIVTPQVGVPLRLVVLGLKARACLTHWLPCERQKGGGRTVPHKRPDDTCPECVQLGQLPRYHAYLACFSDHTCRYYLADLSRTSIQGCPDLDPKSGVVLRGYRIVLRRKGISSNSPVSAELEGPRRGEEVLQPDFDVQRVLERLWGLIPGEQLRID